jgi:hypothetical protein
VHCPPVVACEKRIASHRAKHKVARLSALYGVLRVRQGPQHKHFGESKNGQGRGKANCGPVIGSACAERGSGPTGTGFKMACRRPVSGWPGFVPGPAGGRPVAYSLKLSAAVRQPVALMPLAADPDAVFLSSEWLVSETGAWATQTHSFDSLRRPFGRSAGQASPEPGLLEYGPDDACVSSKPLFLAYAHPTKGVSWPGPVFSRLEPERYRPAGSQSRRHRSCYIHQPTPLSLRSIVYSMSSESPLHRMMRQRRGRCGSKSSHLIGILMNVLFCF